MTPLESMTAALLAWYAGHKRDLPWRRTTNPYHIWVSEVMLQQTRVETVIPYYSRFLERFPTIRALADASLDSVLVLWEGLGYYGRARHLHAAAQRVCTLHGGVLPSDQEALLALPGIGAYTAGAILSIAFGQRTVAVDGNVVRVICRLFDYAQDPSRVAGKRAIREMAEKLLGSAQPGEFNQALMELGATLCVSRAPLCDACPLAPQCLARCNQTQYLRPIPKARAPVPEKALAAALIVARERILIVHRRPQGLLGGLWDLPMAEVEPPGSEGAALAQKLRQQLGISTSVGERLATIRHAYTHFKIVVAVYRCTSQGEPRPQGEWDRFHWLAADEREAFGLTGVTVKILAKVPWPGSGLLL
ncbi:MAG: A/G-specific adenine glycosylase [Anaerolineae bacterium]|nr:A/G-specific adenine glycosylase [Anaerolineae bacterium]